jgi:hypothetical protein
VPPPSLPAAAGLSGRALARNGWLVAAGFGVAIARRALLLPAGVVAWSLLAEGVLLAAARAPFSPEAPLEGALALVTSGGFLVLVGGLWLAGATLGAVLRVTFATGALATLGRDLSGEADAPPRFAAAIAYDLPRVLGTAALAGAAEIGGTGFALGLAVAAGRVSLRVATGGGSPWLAAAVALALTLAIAVPLVLSVVADAAVARSALRGEGPVTALAGAGARFLGRPGTFLLAAILFGGTAAVAASSVQAMGAAVTGFAAGVDPAVMLGPELMIAAGAVLVGAAVELWWLGTVAVLACHEG